MTHLGELTDEEIVPSADKDRLIPRLLMEKTIVFQARSRFQKEINKKIGLMFFYEENNVKKNLGRLEEKKKILAAHPRYGIKFLEILNL